MQRIQQRTIGVSESFLVGENQVSPSGRLRLDFSSCSLPLEALQALQNKDVSIMEANFRRARDDDTSVEDLDELSTHWSSLVRSAVARNLKTSSKTRAKLAGDWSPLVRAGIVGNPRTRAKARGRLVRDRQVRCALVMQAALDALFLSKV